eukprot:3715455-Alexandrium_andersonii.AAC.1
MTEVSADEPTDSEIRAYFSRYPYAIRTMKRCFRKDKNGKPTRRIRGKSMPVCSPVPEHPASMG